MPNQPHRALAPLKAAFPAHGLGVLQFRDMTTVSVPRDHIKAVLTFLRDDQALRYDMLFDLGGVDYLKFPGAKHRFALNYGVLSTTHNDRLWLKVFLDPTLDTSPGLAPRDEDALAKADPGLLVDSVVDVYAAADWMEREAYDLLGIVFKGHPDLRRILTWNGFTSYPLRKDYPLRGIGEREAYKIVTREGA
jgi:NADH-quinone oxidoreductase subunit C